MLGLDDSDRETIPDCEIYPHMMGELSDQVMMRTMPADASLVFDDDGYEGVDEGRPCFDDNYVEESQEEEAMAIHSNDGSDNKTDLDYYILGAFSALNVSDLPLPIQVGERMRRRT